jgi:hypothetical protein
MRTRLPTECIDFLVHQPESGMGYQRVDVFFADGSVQRDCVAFNAEEVEIPDSCRGKKIKDVRLHRESAMDAP